MSVTHLGQSRIGFTYKRSAIFIAVSMSSMLLAGNSQAQPAEPETTAISSHFCSKKPAS